MFSILPKPNFTFSFTFILSSAYAFNLDQSKILLFGKELNNELLTENIVAHQEVVMKRLLCDGTTCKELLFLG